MTAHASVRGEARMPFGKTADGRMVSVEAVERGAACECFCPQCGAALVAAKGEIYRHHFRHYVEGAACTEARETAIHQFAKQVICEKLFVALPDPVGTMTKATAECRLGDVVPDVLAEYDSGETVAIEIWVAHQVPEHKVRHYNNQRQAAVEIDLRPYRLTDKTEADWENVVLHEAKRSWLSSPRYIREAREAERKRWLKEQRKRFKAELAQAYLTERRRLKAEELLRKAEADKARAAAVAEAVRRDRAQREAAEVERRKLKLAEQRAQDAEVRHVLEARLKREMRGPDLQELVLAHGGYDRITAEAWAAYDHELALWRTRVAVGEFHEGPYHELRGHKPVAPAAGRQCQCNHDPQWLKAEIGAGRSMQKFREVDGEYALICLCCGGLWDHRATDRLIDLVCTASHEPRRSAAGNNTQGRGP